MILLPVSLLAAFLSGFAALLYQVVWIREFGQLFGLQVTSLSVVLASFMMGLAIGSYIFGWLSDRLAPGRVFILLELLLGLFVIFFDTFFGGFTHIYDVLARPVSDHPGLLLMVRSILSFAFLLIPSTLIGGSIPVLIKLNTRQLNIAGMRISRLYALYNLGGFLGAFLTGFVFIRTIGMERSLQSGAMMNIMNAVVIGTCLLLTKSPSTATEQESAPPGVLLSKGALRAVLAVFLLEGFSTLAYEILWTRIFVEFSYDKSTYLYTVIIMAFLAGLAIGSAAAARFIDRMRNPLSFLGGLQLGIAVITILQLAAAIVLLPRMMVSGNPVASWFGLSGRQYLFIFFFLLPPVMLMGITFPLVARVMARSYPTVGRQMGIVGLADTVGSVAGSLAASLLLLPLLGVVRSILIVAILNAAGWLLLRNVRIRKSIWNWNLLSIPLAVLIIIAAGELPGTFKSKLGRKPGEALIHFDEAACGTVTVHAYPIGYKALSINSVLFAYNTEDDIRSHSMLAYMPYFHHTEPDTVLVLGFGLGITASCFDQPDIDRIDVAEICPAVVSASVEHFAGANRNIYFNPKLNLIRDDGRSWLDITRRKYDIITCDAIHPRYGNNLYTREYYSLCRERLNDDGVVCQWMPTNWLSEHEYRSLLATFLSVFPDASLWYVNRGVTLMVGSKSPVKIDPALLEERMLRPGIREHMQQAGIFNWPGIIGYYLMSGAEAAAYAGNALVNTDDLPHVEYSKVVSMAPNYSVIAHMLQLRPDFNAPLTQPVDARIPEIIRSKRSELEREMRKDLDMIRFDLER